MRAPLASALVLAAATVAVPLGAVSLGVACAVAVIGAVVLVGASGCSGRTSGDDGDDDDDGGEGEAGEGEGEAGEGEGEAGEGEGEAGEGGEALCGNGLDDDDDGFSDCEDFGCEGFAGCGVAEDAAAVCGDGIDNDGDGYVDCVDFGCGDAGVCGSEERTDAACSNGADDDLDGAVDCADLACEARAPCRSTESDDATCADGVDNDDDTLSDCADPECATLPACSPVENDDATCADGRDNDDDGFVDCVDFDCDSAGVCQSQALRVVHWNVQEIFGGDFPSAQGQAAIDAVAVMLVRMDADVACLNEVHDDEGFALVSLAEAAGYPFVLQSEISTPMAGGLTNACLSRRPFSLAQSRSSDDISTDADANETGRDFAEVRVDVIPGVSAVTIFSAHLKAGFNDADLFRRHIEAVRLRDAVAQVRAERPDDAIIVMGDMNEEIDDEPGLTFTGFPSFMPQSYRLGNDLDFPIEYGPFLAFAQAGLVPTLPTHEDSSDTGTRIPSGRRIDYQLFSGLTLVGDLVYDPCEDNGVDDAPAGNFLVLEGAPVPCGTAEDASDHWPVVADYAP